MQNVIKGCVATVFTIALVVFFFAAGFLANAYRNSTISTSYSEQVEGVDPIAEQPKNFNVFYEALGFMRNEFYGELPDEQRLSYAAIRGVLGRLSDQNTIFVEPPEHEKEQERFQGEFGGIGAQVSNNEEGQLVIVAPIDDTPAAGAGLRANDIVLEVDGEPITGMTLNDAVELIRGLVGTEVTLLISRPNEGEPFSVTLVRDKIPDVTVFHSLLEDPTNIGYIRVGFFSARTTEELRKAITDLQEQGATKLILDLRNNPGGLLDAAIGTSSLFIGNGTIAYQLFNDGTRKPLDARGDPMALNEPLMVLVNEGSASASEILAGALQASDRARLVGTQTYGKGTVQIPYTLQDGSSLHVTIAHWLTPDGIDLSQDGLIPELYVEPTEEQLQAGEDPVFMKAVETLKELP
ncbi:MAG: S41 family peptidase [Ardenticatenaceae bacterium]